MHQNLHCFVSVAIAIVVLLSVSFRFLSDCRQHDCGGSRGFQIRSKSGQQISDPIKKTFSSFESFTGNLGVRNDVFSTVDAIHNLEATSAGYD